MVRATWHGDWRNRRPSLRNDFPVRLPVMLTNTGEIFKFSYEPTAA